MKMGAEELTAESLINGRLRDSTRASYTCSLRKMVKWAKYRKDCDNKDSERGCVCSSVVDPRRVVVGEDIHGTDLGCAGDKCPKRVDLSTFLDGEDGLPVVPVDSRATMLFFADFVQAQIERCMTQQDFVIE